MALKIFFSFLALSLSVANAASDSPGCLYAQRFLALASLYELDSTAGEASETLRMLKQVKVKACSGEYSSSETIYYPNGKTATSLAGRRGVTIYDVEGKTLASNPPAFESNGHGFKLRPKFVSHPKCCSAGCGKNFKFQKF